MTVARPRKRRAHSERHFKTYEQNVVALREKFGHALRKVGDELDDAPLKQARGPVVQPHHLDQHEIAVGLELAVTVETGAWIGTVVRKTVMRVWLRAWGVSEPIVISRRDVQAVHLIGRYSFADRALVRERQRKGEPGLARGGGRKTSSEDRPGSSFEGSDDLEHVGDDDNAEGDLE